MSKQSRTIEITSGERWSAVVGLWMVIVGVVMAVLFCSYSYAATTGMFGGDKAASGTLGRAEQLVADANERDGTPTERLVLTAASERAQIVESDTGVFAVVQSGGLKITADMCVGIVDGKVAVSGPKARRDGC